MFLSEVALGLCLLFLVCTYAAQSAALKSGDKRRLKGLHLVKMGLSLSACAYLFHILGKSPGSPLLILSLLFRIAGITFLWLAWKDHWTRQREQLTDQARLAGAEKDESPAFQTALPPGCQSLYSSLNSRAREALCAAQEEALQRRQCCVDTDHLLLGLLQVPHCTASRILEHHHVPAEKLRWKLAQQAKESERLDRGTELPKAVPALTPRARQVLAMAEIEAHRFDKTFVGTEHLLLGLLLTGTGPAASALFASGMTVDGIRREVIAARK